MSRTKTSPKIRQSVNAVSSSSVSHAFLAAFELCLTKVIYWGWGWLLGRRMGCAAFPLITSVILLPVFHCCITLPVSFTRVRQWYAAHHCYHASAIAIICRGIIISVSELLCVFKTS